MGNEVVSVGYDRMEKMAASLVKSRLFGLDNVDQALALMAIAEAEGRHPAIIARDFHIIQGRPAKRSEAMLRDFITAGGSVTWHQLDDTIADATFSHPQGGTVRIAWDMARAQQAGLANRDMWKKYPRQMLRSRCLSDGTRTVCPAATSGVYTPEEVRDMVADAEVIDVTPPPAMTEGAFVDLTAELESCADLESLRATFLRAYSIVKRDGTLDMLFELSRVKDVCKARLEATEVAA